MGNLLKAWWWKALLRKASLDEAYENFNKVKCFNTNCILNTKNKGSYSCYLKWVEIDKDGKCIYAQIEGEKNVAPH